MIEAIRVFETFQEAADYAKAQAMSSGSTVPISRHCDLWYVGEVRFDHDKPDPTSHYNEGPPNQDWNEHLVQDQHRAARSPIDWSDCADDLDEQYYENYFGGPE